jgi:hypothetical protein
MKKFAFIILAALVFFAAADDTFACSCIPPGAVKEEIKTTDSVFSGKVTGVSKFRGGWKVKFRVEKTWKGGAAKTITLVTAQDSAMCGYNFKAGKKYLIYAKRDDKNKLSVSLCSRTAELSKASEDVKILDELKNEKTSKD